ncbi:hypothetical protein, partial [Paracoccus sp. SSK6]|uniref:hypothetical protein n=1 Tax=Paracoccus sp. SSK6 TaxID=3143131 RepID=UPI003218F1B6
REHAVNPYRKKVIDDQFKPENLKKTALQTITSAILLFVFIIFPGGSITWRHYCLQFYTTAQKFYL